MMFQDISSEHVVPKVKGDLFIDDIAALANAKIIRGYLHRCHFVIIRIKGNARSVLRQAKLKGLICQIREYRQQLVQDNLASKRGEEFQDYAELCISGPLSIFHKTRVYARAFASLLPVLMWTEKFQLFIFWDKSHIELPLCIQTGDPIKVGHEPKKYDSKIEARFFRDFLRATNQWELVREHAPIEIANQRFIFPDFKIIHKMDPERNFYLEILGFWTDEYLEKKFQDFTKAGLKNLILCLDQKHENKGISLKFPAWVLIFKRRIPVEKVVAILHRE